MTELCYSCRRPMGSTVYVIHGRLGIYRQCEWCYEGRVRDDLPELITDSFEKPEPSPLDEILDRLFAMGEA